MVAMGLTALVMTAALPAFIAMLRSSATVKLDTKAKNLSQERLEQMKDLRYHIDRQNGPFLDLLDIYYTNANSAGTTTSTSVAGTTLTGKFVNSGAAANGEPAAPFYRITTGAIAGASGYSQIIDSQFLAPDGSVIGSSGFVDRYDSQTVGSDQAPSLMLGVTIITSWADGTKAKSFRTLTRISDGRPQLPVIQTQGRAVAVDVTSSAADGSTVELQGGVASADGSQSSGSTVAGYATGALATQTGATTISGLLSQFNLPTQAVTSSGAAGPQSGAGCGWYGFGHTALNDITGDISTGLPKAPADVDPLVPANVLSGSITDNSGGSCGLLSYDNLANGGVALGSANPTGFEMGAAPFVKVFDTGSGSLPAIQGAAYVNSNALVSVPQKSTSGAAAFSKRQVILFPNNPEAGTNKGLVAVTLTQASVDCASGTSTTDGTVVGKYSLKLEWWGKGPADSVLTWHTATWSYDSGAAAAPVLASGSDTWDPVNTSLGNGLKLSQLVVASLTGGAPAVVNSGATSGLRGFTNGILTLTTGSTQSNEAGAGYSAIKVQLGQLTCVSDDQR